MRYDAPPLTRDEATEICVYHLRMAASLFQLVPDDENVTLLEEIKRVMEDDFEKVAAEAWATVILRQYNLLKEGD